MKTITNQVRLTAVLLAVLMSTVVLGSTLAGMQAGSTSDANVVVMDKVTIKPSAVN